MKKIITLLILTGAISVQSSDVTVTRAFAFFEDNPDGQECVINSPYLAELHDMAENGETWFENNYPAEALKYRNEYNRCRPIESSEIEIIPWSYLPSVTVAFAFFKDNPLGQECVINSPYLAELHDMSKNGKTWFENNYPAEALEYRNECNRCRSNDKD